MEIIGGLHVQCIVGALQQTETPGFFFYSFDPGEVRVGFQLQLHILGYVVVTTDAIEGVLFLSSPPLWI